MQKSSSVVNTHARRWSCPDTSSVYMCMCFFFNHLICHDLLKHSDLPRVELCSLKCFFFSLSFYFRKLDTQTEHLGGLPMVCLVLQITGYYKKRFYNHIMESVGDRRVWFVLEIEDAFQLEVLNAVHKNTHKDLEWSCTTVIVPVEVVHFFMFFCKK